MYEISLKKLGNVKFNDSSRKLINLSGEHSLKRKFILLLILCAMLKTRQANIKALKHKSIELDLTRLLSFYER